MAEYIERKALIDSLNDMALDYIKDNSVQCSIAAGTVVDIRDNVVMKQPTADVVEVVRCKNCAYCRLEYPVKAIGEEAIEGYYCNMFKQYRKHNDFCSSGIREREIGGNCYK